MSDATVSDAELHACAETLRRLNATDLHSTRCLEVWEAGEALFSSRIIKQRFKGDDVVEFLKKQGNYRGMLKRLEKLHAEVNKAHADRVEAATTRGMNSARIQRTKEVAQHGLVALSAGAEAQRTAHGQMLLNERGCTTLGQPDSNVHGQFPPHPQDWGVDNGTALVAPEPPTISKGRVPVTSPTGESAATGLRIDASGQVLGWAHSGKSLDCGGNNGAEGSREAPENEDASWEEDLEGSLGGLSNVSELRSAFPKGSFRKVCNICKSKYEGVHHFYHQLCPSCGDFNWQKRTQRVDLRGYTAILTGGRVRIGYQIALRLLRCGAECHVTSRFVSDAALRFSLEPDYGTWRQNLTLYYLELCDLPSVEAFCGCVSI